MAAGAVFTPVEEVQRCLVAPWEMVEKVAKVSFREGWVEEPNLTILWVVLEVVAVHMDDQEALEEEEGTLGEAVEIMNMMPVGVGEAPTMLELIGKMNVAITRLVTARRPFHYYRTDTVRFTKLRENEETRRWRTENHNPLQLLFGVSSGVPFHPSEEKKKDGFEGERDIPENNCKEHKTAIILLSVSFMYITRLEDQWPPSVDFYFLFIKNISGSRKIKPWEEVA